MQRSWRKHSDTHVLKPRDLSLTEMYGFTVWPENDTNVQYKHQNYKQKNTTGNQMELFTKNVKVQHFGQGGFVSLVCCLLPKDPSYLSSLSIAGVK